jgi:hypothetical protein
VDSLAGTGLPVSGSARPSAPPYVFIDRHAFVTYLRGTRAPARADSRSWPFRAASILRQLDGRERPHARTITRRPPCSLACPPATSAGQVSPLAACTRRTPCEPHPSLPRLIGRRRARDDGRCVHQAAARPQGG